MIGVLVHTGYMTRRHLMNLLRQRLLVATSLIEPFVWLALFSAVFRSVADIPGFTGGSYVDYLMPGIVVMTAFLPSAWNGVLMLQDIERGTLDRMLVTPVRRSALLLGPVLKQAVGGMVSVVIIMTMGVVLGARYEGGAVGIAVFLAAVMTFSATFSMFSNVVALLVRKEESLVGLMNFVMMPLTFLSSSFMPTDLVPGWVTKVALVNPVNWTVEVGRQMLGPAPDWGVVLTRGGLLLGLGALLRWAGLAALRRYQRTA